jgi:cytochrome c553
MRWGAAVTAAFAGVTAPCLGLAQEKLESPAWAYAIQTGPRVPGKPDDGKPISLPDSGKAFTRTEIMGLDPKRAPGGPADWYPGDHPAMPAIVAKGDLQPGGRGIMACALCHYPNGKGRSENAPVAGQPPAYFIATLKEMASGARDNAEPRKANTKNMYRFAKAMTDAEIEEAAAYYGSIPWSDWITVKESKVAPKTVNSGGLMLTITGPDAGWEPLGHRIVETPVNAEATEVVRDPRSPFLAYVPPGAVARGRRLVTRGAHGSTPCAVCHGADLGGVGVVPAIASRSPSYIARQLNDYRRGARHGAMSPLMIPVAGTLSDDDIIDITAYLASIPAGPAIPASAK